ncbi:NarK family nitrate/nitrite MFS transporter [Coraliomargarita akajimensis]|uniref:Nitrate/nitrite transporter n=1 Tax=Coraliomargarita akajimensis (strain DSM 45221 / IAM 15411 / JCM 23193 / KCTC 12865 / 04OKA010-24) TaxID=583355 RepID=D5EMG3_CORAD|nr:NarK family nitrate/nitrite MFS transporter [Coraliomargarita akajimensis]ADE53369.1 nitrite transporter [Coraliomargarita akajimensis DSM 45221]
MSESKLNILNFKDPSIRTLHFSWVAFFITFVVWFNHAPMVSAITEAFDLTKVQWKALLILNVALTIPARIVIGILVDRFGPRATYSILLMASGVLCTLFALAPTYELLALARFLMGFVGAGFVIGIRMVGEWFPARQVGLAEGIYGGWGNFGSAAAAMLLPSVALLFGGENAWRYALLVTAAVAFIYGIIYYRAVRNTPKGSTYFKPKKTGGLEVTSRKDFYFLIGMNIPMFIALAVLTWRLSSGGVGLISDTFAYVVYAGLVALFAFQVSQIYRVNKDMLKDPEAIPEMHRYKFSQVAILNVNYFVTFGSELAVVSMLPFFFIETFGLDPVKAGFLASGFAFMNLVARPTGGLLSDKFGRRMTMIILILGLALGYFVLSQVSAAWILPLAVVATMCCSFFVQAGEGAVFAMVPLIQRRMTGQIAGMTGAYGNVGAVCFLTVYSFVDASTFFTVIACSSAAAFGASLFLREPKGHTAEVLPDGSVQLIEVGVK